MKKLFTNSQVKKNLLIPAELSKNNLDCLRFFLAVAVIYSHCFVIYYGKIIDTEPIKIFTHNQIDLGGIAVSSFFIISGFLIVKSFENSGTIYEYLVKRILRICPGFYAAFLISVFVLGALGALYSPLKLEQLKFYLQSFAVRRMIFQFFTLGSPMANTFLTNPQPKMINASFWTIQYEFACYLVVPLLGLISILKRKWLALFIFTVSYTLLVLQLTYLIPYNLGIERSWIFVYPSELPRLLSFFFAGACFYFFRDSINLNKFLILLSITAILFASLWVKGFYIVLPLAGTYLVFIFAYHPRIQFYDFAKKGDFSYGLYLYGWPIQQLIVHFFAKYIDANRLFFIAFPLVFLAAYLSWHIVESPFLKMKGLIKKRTIIKQEELVNAMPKP